MRPSYRPKETARTNFGAAMRHKRHKDGDSGVAGWAGASSRVSPQQAQQGPEMAGNSCQQALQIGTEESCGRREPQRVQEAGRRAQVRASSGLRRTRATARQREISDGGTSIVMEPESLRKTHLTWKGTIVACLLATS